MAKEAMNQAEFSNILERMKQETTHHQNKLRILFTSRGYFNAEQAACILLSLSRPQDKTDAIKIMEPRLARMCCADARKIIDAVSVHNDKLIVLDCIKRALTDCQTRLGEEHILSTFCYQNDKARALRILRTVGSSVHDKLGAGGHQGYAALGGLYTQSFPLEPHVYGPLHTQKLNLPGYAKGYGDVKLSCEAKPVPPSVYTGHPSYAYPPDKSWQEQRGYPGHKSADPDCHPVYPSGAPPLGFHSGAPNPASFKKLDAHVLTPTY